MVVAAKHVATALCLVNIGARSSPMWRDRCPSYELPRFVWPSSLFRSERACVLDNASFNRTDF